MELNDFKSNVFSQNGEDGIIEEILKTLNIKEGWVVEFGAWDGKYLSNTFNLLKDDKFKAVYIEGDESRYQDLLKTSEEMNGCIIPICSYVEPTGDLSLTSILKKTDIPLDFEILSIDVDGIDYHIWSNFEDYHPKLVIIEINSGILPDVEFVHSELNRVTGTSFLSMLKLGINKGYTPICHTGNMFFLRNDLLDEIKLNEEYINHPEKMFMYNWIPK